MRPRHLACVLLVAVLAGGCRALLIEADDPAGVRAAKLLARAPLALGTFGYSELSFRAGRHTAAWVGHDEAALLAAWGEPTVRVADPAGGAWLAWRRRRSGPELRLSSGSGDEPGLMTGGEWPGPESAAPPPERLSKAEMLERVGRWPGYRLFRVSADGRIVDYAWKGL